MDSFKLDTKEKFNVVTPNTAQIADITAEKLRQILQEQLQKTPKNVVLNLENVESIDAATGGALGEIAAQYMDSNVSFVLCGLTPTVKKTLDALELTDILNITPTESEAWDIVQMEEIERELFSDEEKPI
ncbi:MAG: STAS domain-containing protein [Chitinophagaceae bacterium]